MYTLDDTIAAISTPLGSGGIGIVRLSGPDALAIASKVFVPSSTDGAHPQTHRLCHGVVVRPDSGLQLDEVLLSYMAAPHSFTRQDVVEINSHGGPLVVRRVLGLVLEHGARMADPGEFTLRAFANGRLDLAQAEAVMDVVSASGDRALSQAVRQLEGHLSRRVVGVRKLLLEALVFLEAGLDFPQDEIPQTDVSLQLDSSERALRELLESARSGTLIRQGVRVALVGIPNVGKSSLLNRLLEYERAIVTEIPGTTRDTLEETLIIKGVSFVLVDTAGISKTEDPVESLGVAKSHQTIQDADLVLMVVDAHTSPSAEEIRLAGEISSTATIVVLNKSDLTPVHDYQEIASGAPHKYVSALTGAGLDGLREEMLQATVGAHAEPRGDLVTNPRHEGLLRTALEAIGDARNAVRQGLPDEMIAIDVRSAVYQLGLLTGENASEELLDTIFSRFCIGK